MADHRPVLRYEDAAERRVDVSGWYCVRCGRFYGEGTAGERMARLCCSTDRPCACGGRITNKYAIDCADCLRKRHDERWAKLERVDWDGESPVTEWDGDRIWFHGEELLDDLGDHVLDGGSVEDYRLVLAEEKKPREFEMANYLADELPEDFDADVPHFREIDRIVNEWMARHRPLSFVGSNKAISVESLKRHLEAYNAPRTQARDSGGR